MASTRADERIYAPTRITPVSVHSASSSEAQRMISAFLEAHDERTRMTGGDLAISGQLRKLEKSLKEEGKDEKKKDKERK
ncbi:hypothetical protein M407DRAFT_243393 [Tulasnella calospora MUT 4182]|uniref:Uncharacterized protein n=1 Tax=Tulasnella calospora MUT 4182 TaxID=1051891 RepID=A0A0C3L0R9_9AGAM|nr:hypothetical protein M407DRAFT_243393 [Tulasnella calospora MUT 4182]